MVKINLNEMNRQAIEGKKSSPTKEEIQQATRELIKKTEEAEGKKIIEKYFKDKKLLNKILEEISKNHLEDNKIKLTAFLVGVSGLLGNHRLRMSMALKGESSVGKDNIIHSVLKHLPKRECIFLTNATQSAIEDDIKFKRVIAFSEMNLNREVGANKHLIEVIKQKAEGGTSSIKKDIRKGMKIARHEKGEQASVLYATIEVDKDKEIDTRFIEGYVEGNETKIKKVNENTIDYFGSIERQVEDNEEKDSWIRKGITYLFNNNPILRVFFPYASAFKEKINGIDIFDNQSSRSMRDLKRVFALASAMAWLYQEQREIRVHNNVKFIIAEPEDFINTLEITGDLFNQTYSGMDKRLLDVLNALEKLGKDGVEWIARDEIEKELGCSTNTIKEHCRTLTGFGCISEEVRGSELNKQLSLDAGIRVKVFDNQKKYYQLYQKGIKKSLIRCQVSELKQLLINKFKKGVDTFDFNDVIDDKEEKEEEKRYQKQRYQNGLKGINEGSEGTQNSEIDTFNLIPSQKEVEK